jgi:hypothetical protein
MRVNIHRSANNQRKKSNCLFKLSLYPAMLITQALTAPEKLNWSLWEGAGDQWKERRGWQYQTQLLSIPAPARDA